MPGGGYIGSARPRDEGFIRPAGMQSFWSSFCLLQLCAASARMWRTIGTSWGFTLREDNSTCVYRNSIHALSAFLSRFSRKGETVAYVGRPRNEWIERRRALIGEDGSLEASSSSNREVWFHGQRFSPAVPLNSSTFPRRGDSSPTVEDGEFIIAPSATIGRDGVFRDCWNIPSERRLLLTDVSFPDKPITYLT